MKSFLSIFCIGKICLCRAGLYAKNKNWIDTDDYFVNNPDSITTDGKFALLSAVWFFGITQGVIRLQINKLAIMPMK
ncbi:hypothetical protein [Helicobacter fennelliae]|uniref:hypothetical protein n=1 Tax=Helicobacter fennelliae TaxID=215 RepID=UPI000E002A1D|nr:hypothetical protein [Helicobacter fennelliae]STQ85111.1 Uncharacterised protein [Helicobacter fennelliae]